MQIKETISTNELNDSLINNEFEIVDTPPAQEKRNDDDPINNNQNQDNPDDFINNEYDERIKYQKNNQALINVIKHVPQKQESDDKNILDE
ncbi:2465_t:CDS:1, partial [Entrophospora sp. SA101]